MKDLTARRVLLAWLLAFVLYNLLYFLCFPRVWNQYRDFVYDQTSRVVHALRTDPPIKWRQAFRADAGVPDELQKFLAWKVNWYTVYDTDTGEVQGFAYTLEHDTVKGLFFSLNLLPALLLATPTRLHRRILLCIAGLVLLTLGHMVIMLCFCYFGGWWREYNHGYLVELYTLEELGKQPSFLAATKYKFLSWCFRFWEVVFAQHSTYLALLTWGLLSWRYWFALLMGEEDPSVRHLSVEPEETDGAPSSEGEPEVEQAAEREAEPVEAAAEPTPPPLPASADQGTSKGKGKGKGKGGKKKGGKGKKKKR